MENQPRVQRFFDLWSSRVGELFDFTTDEFDDLCRAVSIYYPDSTADEHLMLTVACLMDSEFAVWHHVSYEKLCCKMYARAVGLGIRSMLITGGDVDDEFKLEMLTNFDTNGAKAQMVFSTAAVTVGMNFKKRFSACVVITGRFGSGCVEAGQSAGRPGRV